MKEALKQNVSESIKIYRTTRRKAKILAAQTGVTMAEIFDHALDCFLKQPAKQK